MLWVKAFRILAIICWHAALFYLPRLFVYCAMSNDEVSKGRFKIMEHKLYRGTALLFMIATQIFGFWLLSCNTSYYMSGTWKMMCSQALECQEPDCAIF